MTNPFLEKIALTVEDTRDARKKGDAAFRHESNKGAKIGAGLGAVAGGVWGARLAHKVRIRDVKTKALMGKGKVAAISGLAGAALGAFSGMGVGAGSMQDSAASAKVGAVHKRINRGLNKEASVSRDQVQARLARNDILAQGAASAGLLGGAVVGGTAVGGVALHKGMRSEGGYAAVKTSLKNAYNKKKENKEIKVGKGSYLTKMEDIKLSRGLAPHVDRPDVARNVGKAFGKIVGRRLGIATVAGSALAGSYLATHTAQKSMDKSDVNHYAKLSGKNLRNGY